jgi:hypothetical protein
MIQDLTVQSNAAVGTDTGIGIDFTSTTHSTVRRVEVLNYQLGVQLQEDYAISPVTSALENTFDQVLVRSSAANSGYTGYWIHNTSNKNVFINCNITRGLNGFIVGWPRTGSRP